MEPLALYVSVPVAAFRAPYAREYLETLACPPPATVYGMLLSLVGEENRYAHVGAEIALAMLSQPALSTVLRTSWRLKTGAPPGTGSNKRPDYQELLTDVRLAVWVRPGRAEKAARPLSERVRAAVDREEAPSRYGALALGESTHLVDEVRRLRAGDGARARGYCWPTSGGSWRCPCGWTTSARGARAGGSSRFARWRAAVDRRLRHG